MILGESRTRGGDGPLRGDDDHRMATVMQQDKGRLTVAQRRAMGISRQSISTVTGIVEAAVIAS